MKNNKNTRYYLISSDFYNEHRNSKIELEDLEYFAPCKTLVSAQRYQKKYPDEIIIFKVDYNIERVK